MSDLELRIVNAVAAFFVAVLSGLGVGSGGLFVIWLTLMGVGATQARGMNLLFFVFSASAAFLFHLKNKRNIDLGLALYLASFALLGTVVGGYMGRLIEGDLLRRIFGGLLVLSGCYTLFGKKLGKKG
ncbi:MAG: sulfite exporter TauE/SafE family protein [Clostridia bacterium]|nr:sulfite exporter TauE/SafE family protein [Clostridia bacterium]